MSNWKHHAKYGNKAIKLWKFSSYFHFNVAPSPSRLNRWCRAGVAVFVVMLPLNIFSACHAYSVFPIWIVPPFLNSISIPWQNFFLSIHNCNLSDLLLAVLNCVHNNHDMSMSHFIVFHVHALFPINCCICCTYIIRVLFKTHLHKHWQKLPQEGWFDYIL